MELVHRQMHAAAEAQLLALPVQQRLPNATMLPAPLPLAYTPVSAAAAEALVLGSCPECSVTYREL